MSNLRTVTLEEVKENPVALRAVDRENAQYLNLVADVKRRGVIQPISVREKEDEGVPYYEICDGLHRYSAAIDAGRATIDVKILDANDAEVEETQIIANLIRVDTKPVDYTKQLLRMMARNPLMTIGELSDRISQSEQFIIQRLSLLKLDPAIQALVNDGEIKLNNAYALSKLPVEEQHNWTDDAIAMAPKEFVPAVQTRAKELRDAARQGKSAEERVWEPTAHLRPLKELKTEFADGEVGPAICAAANAEVATDGFALGVQWAISLDPASVESQKAKFDQRKAEREAAKNRRTAERTAKKAKEAAEKAEAAAEAAKGLDEE